MRISRKDFLKLGLVGGAELVLPFGVSACGGGDGDGSTGRVLESAAQVPAPFGVPLPIPPVLGPVRSDGSADYYEITQKVGKAEILPGLTTEVWGYNGIFPGPTIESRRGRRTVIEHRNELEVPVVVHLHGGKAPAEHDGYPTDVVLPVDGWDGGHGGDTGQGTKEYVYPVDQPAATLWYHDHRMDFTGPQVYRGLAGFHIIRDDEEDALPLPKGEREIPLMICDRSFAEDGSFDYPAIDPTLRGEPGVEGDFMRGVLGDVILVNGAPWPFLEVTNTRYRFRILNASNARRFKLALDPPPREGPSFVQVGSDVGLLARPIKHDQIEVAPAERFDVVADFSAYPVGTQVTLTNEYGADGATGQVMRFRIARQAKDDLDVPSRLVEVERLSKSDAAVTREFRFARGPVGSGDRTLWTINGQAFDPNRIDAQPKLGATEIWKLRTNVHHPVHIHLAHFQVLSRNQNRPGPYDAGWKDTIDLASGEQAEIIAKFTGYRGRYVFHCHNLEHEDMMMMSNLEVV